jgi:nitroreductase
LAWAIPRRRTSRGPFKDIPVPAGVRADLVAAAQAEGAVLQFAVPGVRDALLSLVRTAERYLVDTPAYHEELAQWSGERPGRADGIPASAVGKRSARGAVPVRDLSLALPGVVRPMARFEHDPAIAVLYGGDTPPEWVRAGEALQRVLLTATARGVDTGLMTQPLEVPQLRGLIADRDTGRAAHAIIRFGYARLPAAPSPRRPVADVLRPGTGSGALHREHAHIG